MQDAVAGGRQPALRQRANPEDAAFAVPGFHVEQGIERPVGVAVVAEYPAPAFGQMRRHRALERDRRHLVETRVDAVRPKREDAPALAFEADEIHTSQERSEEHTSTLQP